MTNFSLERTPDGNQRALKLGPQAKDKFLEQLRVLLLRVKETIAKTQERYKRDFDKGVREKNKKLGDGIWVCVDDHSTTKGKLNSKTCWTLQNPQNGQLEVPSRRAWLFPIPGE